VPNGVARDGNARLLRVDPPRSHSGHYLQCSRISGRRGRQAQCILIAPEPPGELQRTGCAVARSRRAGAKGEGHVLRCDASSGRVYSPDSRPLMPMSCVEVRGAGGECASPLSSLLRRVAHWPMRRFRLKASAAVVQSTRAPKGLGGGLLVPRWRASAPADGAPPRVSDAALLGIRTSAASGRGASRRSGSRSTASSP
jgi:hypothetical protein